MSALEVAIQATDRLQNVVDHLRTRPPCVQFCVSLKVILIDLLKWLQSLSEDEYSETEADALLRQLDNLCRLQEASNEVAPHGVMKLENRYPAVALLLADSKSVILAISHVASSRKAQRQRRMTLSLLEAFLPETTEEEYVDTSPSDTDLRSVSKEPPECEREIRLLHNALFTRCLCTDSDEMSARIRLRSTLEDDEAKVTFGMLFMAHPHRTDLQSQPWWQDTHFSITRTVNFETGSGIDYEEIGPDSETPFCSYISAQDVAGLMMLKFVVKGPRLFFEEQKEPSSHWAFDEPSISLGQLLEGLFQSKRDLTEKRKEVLSWLLAKSVWQYYSSPWMQQPWNKESVHFLLERRDTEGHEVAGIFVSEPLLSVSIARHMHGAGDGQEKAGGQQKRRLPPFSKPVHLIPKILALGVMLVEIQLGRPIETLYSEAEWSRYCPQGKKNQNTDFKICKDIIAKKHFFHDISDPLELLIKTCIHPSDSFNPPQVRDEEGVRHALYPLINRLDVYLSKRKPYNVKPLTLSDPLPSTQSLTAAPSPLPRSLPTVPKPNITTHRPGHTMGEITNSTSTKDWFDRMASLNYILKAREGDTYDQVKIAVLDTGVDLNDAASEYIDGYRDFVSGNDKVKCDNTGHGTTSISLIFDMCESASVYAVRIFETDVANENSQELAVQVPLTNLGSRHVQALDWCIKERMDVVCMACGFADTSQELFDKVHEASGKMLILAAPTNESNAGEIAYPARYDNDVICIFSTNGAVTKSQRHNPSRGLGMYNFAILGEDIKTMSGEVRSGTSFSTAIAAGLVGRLLEFSRHSDCKGRISNASMLKVKYGMTKALMSMAMKDSEFHCLKPRRLLPKGLRNQTPFGEHGYPHPKRARDGARLHL
ncbi:subtilisin-like protein [Apiospora aurea]|uniref:Subtilisin-like protein n=1 Tax=Apiospora aurea TaxID=335848 RepID=A0ABR1Q276_9PEZI